MGRKKKPQAIGSMGGSVRAMSPFARTIVQMDEGRPLHLEAAALVAERWRSGIDDLAMSLGIEGDRLQEFLAGNCGLHSSAIVAMASRLRCQAKFLLNRKQTEVAKVLSDSESAEQGRARSRHYSKPMTVDATVLQAPRPAPDPAPVTPATTTPPPAPLQAAQPRLPTKPRTAAELEAAREYHKHRKRLARQRQLQVAREYGAADI